MFADLKGVIRNYFPVGRLSYSQEGEDLVLARILGELEGTTRFFVDVGAHHPARFSNTYYFYRRGWRGLNIDPLPGTTKLFKRMRPEDIAIECGVGEMEGVLEYYMFNEPALNTFSHEEARKKDVHPYHIVQTKQIPVRPLRDILDQYIPAGQQIDFMSIDVEGFDHEVVTSNDWERHRPRVLLVELLNTGLENARTHPTAVFLKQRGYSPVAKTFNTWFFMADKAFEQMAGRGMQDSVEA